MLTWGSVIAICGCWADALELQCQHQAPDWMSRVCVCCGVVRVKFAAEKQFSSLVFIASLQSPKVLCDSRAPQRTCFNRGCTKYVKKNPEWKQKISSKKISCLCNIIIKHYLDTE